MNIVQTRATHLVLQLAGLVEQSPSSIEILPGGLEDWELEPDFPFLYKEKNLGIPKRVLYVLYLAAVSMLGTDFTHKGSTIVILIANPSHQTALHSRKRLIQKGILAPEKELEFIGLLIRGSAECAKESIVWDHRRWIFRHLYDSIGDAVCRVSENVDGWSSFQEKQTFPKLPTAAVRNEFALIRKACEIYPRNYHSWSHWHYVMDVVWSLAECERGKLYIGIIRDESSRLRQWIDTHISDFSAMHQLSCLVRLVDHSYSSIIDDFKLEMESTSAIDHALSLTSSFPNHESLWMYLRILLTTVDEKERWRVLDQVKRSPVSSNYRERFLSYLIMIT